MPCIKTVNKKSTLTVTGASTRWTLLSSTSISIAFKHRALTSDSLSGSQFFNCSICLSRSDMSSDQTVFGSTRISRPRCPDVRSSLRGLLRFRVCFVGCRKSGTAFVNQEYIYSELAPTLCVIFTSTGILCDYNKSVGNKILVFLWKEIK